MITKLESLDMEKGIGDVTLSDGRVIHLPKLTLARVIRLAKYIAVDLAKIYGDLQEVLTHPDLSDMEKFALMIEELDEKQVVHILSILLDITDEEAMELEISETLDIFLLYSEKINLGKIVTQCQALMKQFVPGKRSSTV